MLPRGLCKIYSPGILRHKTNKQGSSCELPCFDSSQNQKYYVLYTGVTWGVDIGSDIFAEASFGGSVHDGEKRTLNPDRKELGRRALFYGAVSLGRHMSEHVTVSLMIDHASNADLCDANESLSNAGVRLGYKFKVRANTAHNPNIRWCRVANPQS